VMTSLKYKVHKFKLRMTEDQDKLERFSNSLDGKIVAIIPDVNFLITAAYVDFILVIEKVS
jgi:hypothetical protein